MKLNFTSLITFLLFSNLLFSQADLVITAAGFDSEEIDKGDFFIALATVANAGNAVAGTNYLAMYYSKDLSIENDEPITRVSIKELAPGESQEVTIIYPIPTSISSGDHFLIFEIDPLDFIQESDEDNLYCAADDTDCLKFTINNRTAALQKFTYPILFIHGLNDSDKTWYDFANEAAKNYGWTYGGRLNYCLNPDGYVYASDDFIWSFVDISSLSAGDFYYLNFDVSTNGEPYIDPFEQVISNQSAIVKQGWAVHEAVQMILNVTGAEKVILVGHSMGGLAARQYLQNPENWQGDGEHHIAKLLTIGTPNGGSNASGAAFVGLIKGVYERSEAVRDLRYPSLLFEGQFLYGGVENSLSLYYNDDVDCNGYVGDEIVGLNEKVAPSDVSYSCIVGIGENLPYGGDGIVDVSRADLNNYLLAQPPLSGLHADRFDVTTFHTDIHKVNHSTLIRGLDEPAFYDLAYPVPLNSLNFGYSTEQAENSLFPAPDNEIDWDDFVIEITENGLLEVDIWNIPVDDFALFLLDANYNVLEEVQSSGDSNIGFAAEIGPGTYYLELGSIPTANSWRYPYGYSVLFTPDSGLSAAFASNVREGCVPMLVNFSNESAGNPTSYSWTFEGGTPGTSTAANPSIIYEKAGIYPVSLTVRNAAGVNTASQNGYVIVKSIPIADFDYTIRQDTVVFSNRTKFDIEVPDFRWNFGDGQTSTATSPTHVYQNDGVYPVKLTVSNSCGATERLKSVALMTVAATDPKDLSSITVFPNPGKDELNVRIEGDFNGSYRISLVNSIGQHLQQLEVEKYSDVVDHQITVSDLPGGTYYVQISSDREHQMRKFVKE